MAKTSSVARQAKRMKMVARMRPKRDELKKIIQSPRTSEEDRAAAVIALNKMPRDSSPVRLKNRCALTGRARGYLRKFGLSRLCFREMANSGLLPGVFKASW